MKKIILFIIVMSIYNISIAENKIEFDISGNKNIINKTNSGDIFNNYNITKIEKEDKYIDNQDGTILDSNTGLMWKKCIEGQHGKKCIGQPDMYSWFEAIEKFYNITFSKYQNWRLPTIDELKTFPRCGQNIPDKFKYDVFLACSDKSLPTVNRSVFPNVGTGKINFIWSSTTSNGVYEDAFGLSNNRLISIANKNIKFQIRLVRKKKIINRKVTWDDLRIEN